MRRLVAIRVIARARCLSAIQFSKSRNRCAGKTGGLIPAQAGIQYPRASADSIANAPEYWMPAFAGMTTEDGASDIAVSFSACSAPDARHRPVFGPAPGHAGLPVPSSPKGRAERQGVSPRPRRPHGLDAGSPHAAFATAPGQWPSPTPKIVELNRAVGSRSSPAFRTRMDFAACCITDQGIVACADPARIVRAVARACTWTVRPSCRRQSPVRLSAFRIGIRRFGHS